MKVPPCKPDARLTLVSHVLCPYMQRAAITLAEKRVSFARRDVDLSNKPAWFLDVSPLGKTPVLLVDDVPVFESAVICEYLDETTAPRLHPDDALERARHRGWIEVASAILNTIAGFYNAVDADALESRRGNLVQHFARVEAALRGGEGNSYFSGANFSLVDAAFAPAFRYFDAFDTIADFGIFKATPKVCAWRAALAARPSVRGAAALDYPVRLRRFLEKRDRELSRLMMQRDEIAVDVSSRTARITSPPAGR